MSKTTKKHNKCEYLNMGAIHIYVGFCGSEKAYKKELKRLEIEGEYVFVPSGKGACVNFFTKKDADTVCLVCYDVNGNKDLHRHQIDALLAHEAVHVMQECREVMGGDDHGREFEAYTTQYVFQFLLNCVYGVSDES